MGVPAFFKWLTLRYPNIVIDANENIPILNGLDLNKIISSNYIDSSLPSIDNLYFDMNGIIIAGPAVDIAILFLSFSILLSIFAHEI